MSLVLRLAVAGYAACRLRSTAKRRIIKTLSSSGKIVRTIDHVELVKGILEREQVELSVGTVTTGTCYGCKKTFEKSHAPCRYCKECSVPKCQTCGAPLTPGKKNARNCKPCSVAKRPRKTRHCKCGADITDRDSRARCCVKCGKARQRSGGVKTSYNLRNHTSRKAEN